MGEVAARLKPLAVRLAHRLGLRRLPRIVTLREFVPSGCRFEITNRTEAFRVERYGGEERFTRSILAELKASDTFYDIGASVGLVSVHAAFQGASVLAFEPDPAVRSRLETNVRLNSLENVRIVPWAVSDAPGDATLYTDGVDGISPSLRSVGSRSAVVVRTDSIDDALQRGDIPPPTVLKLDVEGAEILALKGMRQLLAGQEPPRTIFVEIHPQFLPSFGSSAAEVEALLKSAGYHQDFKAERDQQIHCVYRKVPVVAD